MSGCHNTETLPRCKHGTLTKLGCLECFQEIEGDLGATFAWCIRTRTDDIEDKLINHIASTNNRLEALHEHKLRQIDENRKISKRIDELQKVWQQCSEANPIAEIEERFEELESKLEAFDEDAEFLDSLKLPQRIKKIEERLIHHHEWIALIELEGVDVSLKKIEDLNIDFKKILLNLIKGKNNGI